MSIFAVLLEQDNPKITNAMAEKLPNDHYKVTSTSWFVSFKGTVKELADLLGITSEGGQKKGEAGSAIVLSISTYWGVANTDIWEWMKAKIEEGNG